MLAKLLLLCLFLARGIPSLISSAHTTPTNKNLVTAISEPSDPIAAAASRVLANDGGLPLCTDNLHIHGRWQGIDTIQKSFPCCGWDYKDYTWNTTICDAEARGGFHKVGGHACYCDDRGSRTEANPREKYRWVPDKCHLLPFDGQQFCRLLGTRKMLIIGDSTFMQTGGTLVNLLIAFNGSTCVPQIQYTLNNLLLGPSEKRKWYEIATEAQPDIILFGFGAHIHSIEQQHDLFRDFTVQYHEYVQQFPQVKFILKLQNPGHIDCEKATTPILEQPYINPSHDKFQWHLFRIFDEFCKYAATRAGIKVLDMYPLYLRPDSHPTLGDCLHFCLPGPLDIIGSLLLTMLTTGEI